MQAVYYKLTHQDVASDLYVTETHRGGCDMKRVRRLTPLECERLQGFPDGWTDIGEWVDTKGKTHKPADSPRYKALGNSIAVGVANRHSGFWCWVMKRISAQYERDATLGSLFDGIGGFPLAWETYNGSGSARWASEIEEFPIAVTKKHFPQMKHVGDITKIHGYDLEPVDVITGGSPCQDLSVAGKRAGLSGERSGLFMDQMRIVKEMREHDRECGRADEYCRPRHLIWENVPGAFTSGAYRGADFAAVLEEVVKVVEPEAASILVPDKGWPSSGIITDDLGRFSIAWRVHDAQFWGVPQRRKRICLVADFAGRSAGEILFERKGVSRHPESRRETREGVAEDTEGSTG